RRSAEAGAARPDPGGVQATAERNRAADQDASRPRRRRRRPYRPAPSVPVAMRSARLLVMGAGSAGAENLIKSLRGTPSPPVLLGCNDDRFVLRHSAAEVRSLTRAPGSPRFVSALRRLIRESRVDLVPPTIDRHVKALSDARRQLRGRVFLPAGRVITLCRDKYRLISALRRHGVPAPATFPVRRPDDVDGIFARLGCPSRVWCRPRTGTCARGGAAVSTPEQARQWISVWETMQSVPPSAFTLAEFLPGREILCPSVWHR